MMSLSAARRHIKPRQKADQRSSGRLFLLKYDNNGFILNFYLYICAVKVLFVTFMEDIYVMTDAIILAKIYFKKAYGICTSHTV